MALRLALNVTRQLAFASRSTIALSRKRMEKLPVFRAPYSAAAGLTKEAIESRVLQVVKDFEKVNPSKVAVSSNFAQDLGLDSLDCVEVVMAVEEEFAIEIPDEDADAIQSVQQGMPLPFFVDILLETSRIAQPLTISPKHRKLIDYLCLTHRSLPNEATVQNYDIVPIFAQRRRLHNRSEIVYLKRK